MSSYSEGQTHQLMDALEVNKWLTTDITRLGQATPEQHQAIRDVLNGKAEITNITYPVQIDYSNTFEQHITNGHYGWRNPDISEKNFSIKGTGKIKLNLGLINYNNSTSADVLKAIATQDYRPATIEELLVFGATYPELQWKLNIIALGSVWRPNRSNESRYIAYLYKDCSGRSLSLCLMDKNWNKHDHFLVVYK